MSAYLKLWRKDGLLCRVKWFELAGVKKCKGALGGGGGGGGEYKEGVPIRVGVAAWRPTHLNSASCLILAALSSRLAPTAELLYTQTHVHTLPLLGYPPSHIAHLGERLVAVKDGPIPSTTTEIAIKSPLHLGLRGMRVIAQQGVH